MRLPALIVLVCLTACAASPRDRLVGAWEVDDTEFMRMLLEDSSPPWFPSMTGLGYRKSDPLATEPIVPPEARVRATEPVRIIETFHANGTYTQDDGRGQPLVGSWRVWSVEGDTMVVALTTGEDACESQHTYFFEMDDTVRELGGFFGGMMRKKRVTTR